MDFQKLLEEKQLAETQLEKANQKFDEAAEPEFNRWFKELLTEWPELVTISWSQSQYQNDEGGSYFSSSHSEAEIECEELSDERQDALNNKVQNFLDNFSDDDMERIFGESSSVTISKDGVTVEDYYY
jgi:hypothetical protein